MICSVTRFEFPNPHAPFRLTELAGFDYCGYRLVNVFRRITEEQRNACVRMWLEERALPTEEAAWRRSLEVCYLIMNPSGDGLAGVNTVYVATYPPQNAAYFFVRMFIRPGYRGGGLMIAGTTAAVCHLKTHHAREGVRGVVFVNENPKLFRSPIHSLFASGGYQFDGVLEIKQYGSEEPRRRETWRLEFADVELVDRPR